MQKRISFLIIVLTVWWATPVNAQQLVGGGFKSLGAFQSGSQVILSSGLGGCPGCGTLEGDSAWLFQGLPYPDGADCFTVGFEVEEVTDSCGTVYDFFYTGDADPLQAEFLWTFGADGFPQSSQEVNPAGVSFAAPGPKEITLRVEQGGCWGVMKTTLQVEQPGFSTNPLVTPVTCRGGKDGRIEVEVLEGVPPYEILWSSGAAGPLLSDLPAGTYAYTATDAQGCLSTHSVVLPDGSDSLHLAEAQVQNATCRAVADGRIQVSADGGTAPYAYLWSNGSNDTALENLPTGTYDLTVEDARGCRAAFQLQVKVDCQLVIYDIISPNGDDVNDVWIIEGIEDYPENEVFIYNRWGDVVFHRKGYTNDWAGTTSDGRPLPDGAYYYTVKLRPGDETPLSGSVTIVR